MQAAEGGALHPRLGLVTGLCGGCGAGLVELVRLRLCPSLAWVGAYEGPITSNRGMVPGPNTWGDTG